jgi:hypothetical protein
LLLAESLGEAEVEVEAELQGEVAAGDPGVRL